MLILKTDSFGSLLWQKKIGNSSSDYMKLIRQTPDHGYIFSGSTYVSTSNSFDLFLVKMDSVGNLNWANSYNDANYMSGYGFDLHVTSDSGYLYLGQSAPPGLEFGKTDFIKTDKFGNVGCSTTILPLYDSIISLSISSPTFTVTTGSGLISASTIVGCGCFSDTTICSPTSIPESTVKTELKIYPNPFASKFTVETETFYQNGVVRIFDIFGRELIALPFQGNKIEVERGDLASGIYFIQLFSDFKQIGCEKVIIQ